MSGDNKVKLNRLSFNMFNLNKTKKNVKNFGIITENQVPELSKLIFVVLYPNNVNANTKEERLTL